MDKNITLKLIEETTQEIVANNPDIFNNNNNIAPEILEVALKLSALTTINILEKLELIGNG
jgi:hypothetical protein